MIHLKKSIVFLAILLLVFLVILPLQISEVRATTTIDSYSETNQDNYSDIVNVHPVEGYGDSAIGQCFTGLAGYQITSCQFYLKKGGSPVGNLVACIYAITGTFGYDAKPTGSALATSETYAMASLTTSYQLITFTFATPLAISAQYYCVDVEAVSATTLDDSNYVRVGSDASGAHSGNYFEFYAGGWHAVSAYDTCFYVFGYALPTIGEFQAPSGRIDTNSYFFLNTTINHPSGIANFENATLTLNYTINLNWFNSTNTFTKTGDASSYCTLGSNSKRTTVNSTAYKLSWNISFNIPLNWDIANAIVFDSDGLNGTGTSTNLFITDYVNIDTFTVDDNRRNIGETASFTVGGKYAYDSSTWSGTYTLNDTKTKSTVGKYGYNISSITDSNYGLTAFSQTASDLYVIFDRGVITISANTTSPAPNAYVNFTITAIYDFDDTPITSWTVNVLRNSTHFADGNFTDGGYTDLFYVYTAENMTENTYGLTSFTSNTVTVYWSTYVALTIKTLDLDSNILTEAIVYFNTTQITVDSNGLATKTGIVKNTNVTVKVEWHGIMVNGTWTVNMTATKTIEAECNVWQITVNARDDGATMLSLSSSKFVWTFPNGTQVNNTRSDGSWIFKIMNGTHYYRIEYQGQWVSENVTLPVYDKNVTVINKNCWVYSLTAYITDVNNEEKSGSTLTLTRTDGHDYTTDGLSPVIAGYYNTTHARYVWSQLANQTSSYTVTASLGGQSASTTTSLTANTEALITLPAGTTSGSTGGYTPPPVEQPPPYIPPIELPKVPGPEFNYGILVLVGVVGVAVVVGITGRRKPSIQKQWERKTRHTVNLEKKWKKKARRNG